MKRIIAFILVLIIIVSATVSMAYAKTYGYIYTSGEVYPESEHNYQNDIFCTWEYTYSMAADGLFVTFSEETSLNEVQHNIETEYGEAVTCDNLYVSYPYENSWKYISDFFRGKELSGKTLYIPVNRFRITLSTDSEESDFGFSIERISTEPPENETVIRYHYTGSDKADYYDCFGKEDAVVSDLTEILSSDYAFAGWSTKPDGKTEYVAYDTLKSGNIYDLYAVWINPLIEFEDSFSFLNSEVGNVYPAEDNYYMTENHYNVMISNFFKNFGIGPIPAPLIAAVLSTYPSWEHRGSCYGIATSVFLNYYGEVNFLEGTEAESLSEIELNGDLISRINYYQALSAASYLCENLAVQRGTPIYKEQMQNMFETVKNGKPVLFSYYDYGKPYMLSTGHTVVLIGAFNDNNGNNYLVACDSNYRYSKGVCHYYRLTSDFTRIFDCGQNPDVSEGKRIGGFNWTADYKQFSSFDINGEGHPAAWYSTFFNHILYWVKTVFSVFMI